MERQHWNWLVDSVGYFRGIGFLSEFAGLSDEDVARRIAVQEQEACRASHAAPFWTWPDSDTDVSTSEPTGVEEWDAELAWLDRPRPDRRDLGLVRWDKARICWEDGEGDIRPVDGVYVRVIYEWSRISRGIFLPADVREVWDKPQQWPDCSVTLLFQFAGRDHFLHPWNGYGWIDFGIVNGINALIQHSGFAFEMWDTGDQTTCLIVLSLEEKRRLIAERGWQFLNVTKWGDVFR